jgi:transcriptional repressor NrdR
MKCPFCHLPNTFVKDSRDTAEGTIIRRRRNCNNCSGKFTTFERVQLRELVVVKRSGAKKTFDRNKIEQS